MKYFIDTEFHQYKKKPLFSKSIDTIELISIGIIDSDNREYYAISKDFDVKEAWNRWQLETQSGDMRNIFPEGKKEYWLRENVLKPIWRECLLESEQEWTKDGSYERFAKGLDKGEFDSLFTFKSFKKLINKYGKTNEQIAKEVKDFIGTKETVSNWDEVIRLRPHKIYGYFSAYDYVVFSFLFGGMESYPQGYPMLFIDLKQMLDEKLDGLRWLHGRDIWSNAHNSLHKIGKGDSQKGDVLATLNEKLKRVTKLDEYPKQTNEHNALADAIFNKNLYNFINKL